MSANQPTPLEVKVWGDFACFTRPEMKVERVTYPVMTPSAARVYWKRYSGNPNSTGGSRRSGS